MSIDELQSLDQTEKYHCMVHFQIYPLKQQKIDSKLIEVLMMFFENH